LHKTLHKILYKKLQNTLYNVSFPRFVVKITCSTGSKEKTTTMSEQKVKTCPVCCSDCVLLGRVDFNRPCLQLIEWTPSGTLVDYFSCLSCGFCYAPLMYGWSLEDFKERVYNDDYIKFDPDYRFARPADNASMMTRLAPSFNKKHLDYGGGSGVLSRILAAGGWNSVSYDPFVDAKLPTETFDLVTAFEVFEHVPDIKSLFGTLYSLLVPGGTVVFSTLLSDGNLDRNVECSVEWWYLSPRNGHISLFSKKSLEYAAQKWGFQFTSFSCGMHMLTRE
jgi:SAM-dependent methyltransferase